MACPGLCLMLCLSILSQSALAASAKERAAEGGVPVPVAGLSAPATAASQPAEPAGAVASLPDLPVIRETTSLHALPAEKQLQAPRPSRISFTTQQRQGVSPLASMPFAGTARRLGAQRFNTVDGSMLDDFAICYRMSGRSSIEIIPGDPAPVKLPVVSMANNTGVTVGLVLRLSK